MRYRRGLLTSVLIHTVLSRKSVHAKPVQLVQPSKDHKAIEVCPEGLAILRGLDAPVAVISAVGAIHTGKSFLLNQLLGVEANDHGFPVGYTVRPETSGIWIWDTPTTTVANNAETHVVYLDTEGLFSPNVTSIYDAKLFAIATLLSSEVIYNTVKFIDNHHVEALELLIRRTNLFGLRAYARQSMDPESSKQISNLSAFLRLLVPNQLSWVVQDFVQDLGRTQPEEWLRELLQKDVDQHEASVRSFFSHVDCVPLPLPSANSAVLQKLDQAEATQLDRGYQTAVGNFRKRLLERARSHPKIKATDGAGKTAMSGSDIADLLSFLVDAANLNKDSATSETEPFPQLPSMAEQFTSLQLKLMKSDILTIEEQDLVSAIQQAYNAGKPLTSMQFRKAVDLAEHQAHALWNSTVKGLVTHKQLSGELGRAERDFVAGLSNNQDRVSHTNCDFVSHWCKEFTEELLRDFNTSVMAQTDRAMLPSTLNALLSRLEMPITTRFHDTMSKDNGSWAFGNSTDCCASSLGAFSESLRAASDAARKKNDRLTMTSFQLSQQTLLDQWQSSIKEKSSVFTASYSVMTQSLTNLKKGLIDQFDIDMAAYASLPVFRQQRMELDGLLDLKKQEVEEKWQALCQEQADKFLRGAEARYAYELRRVVALPSDEDVLERLIVKKSDELRTRFRASVFCAASPFGRRFSDRLERLLMDTAKSLRNQNIETYKAISANPLEEVKNQLQEEAETYFFPFGFKLEAERRVVQALKTALQSYEEHSGSTHTSRDENGEVSQASAKMIAEVARRFIKDDLQDVVTLIWSALIWQVLLAVLFVCLSAAIWILLQAGEVRASVKFICADVILGLTLCLPSGRYFLKQISFAVLRPLLLGIGAGATTALCLLGAGLLVFLSTRQPKPSPPPKDFQQQSDQCSPFTHARRGITSAGPFPPSAHTPLGRGSVAPAGMYGDELDSLRYHTYTRNPGTGTITRRGLR